MTFTGCPAHLRRRTLFEKNGACLPVLFHVLEPRVHNLFDAEEFGAEDVAGIVDLTAQVRAQIIDPPIGIAQPTIIHEDANEHRQGGYADRQERLSGVGHELIVARGPPAHPTDPPATSGKPSSPYSHKDRSTLSALAARSESRLPDSARPAARNPPAQSDRAHAERPPGSPIPPPAAGTKRPPRYLSRSPPAHCARPPRGIHGHLLPEPPCSSDRWQTPRLWVYSAGSTGRRRSRYCHCSIPATPRAGWRETCSAEAADRERTRLNSSHLGISYAVFCLKKKT